MKFRVIDKQTGKEPDLEKLAAKEDWAKELGIYKGMGFALSQDGYLLAFNSLGKYIYCPEERFKLELILGEGEYTWTINFGENNFIGTENEEKREYKMYPPREEKDA